MKEDCLSLNVWTPGVNDNAKRAVLVSFHGGGWATGSGNVPIIAVEVTADEDALLGDDPCSVLPFFIHNPDVDAGSTYLLRLHFCETSFDGPNQRTFNVNVNDVQVLSEFDIFAAAGARTPRWSRSSA